MIQYLTFYSCLPYSFTYISTSILFVVNQALHKTVGGGQCYKTPTTMVIL